MPPANQQEGAVRRVRGGEMELQQKIGNGEMTVDTLVYRTLWGATSMGQFSTWDFG